jgi:hypothetical protein
MYPFAGKPGVSARILAAGRYFIGIAAMRCTYALEESAAGVNIERVFGRRRRT